MNWLKANCALAAAGIAFVIFNILNRLGQLDDGLIYYRYLENALAGHGLVYNRGEYINALTSPLYTWISLIFAWLAGGNIQASQIFLDSMLFAGTVFLMLDYAQRFLNLDLKSTLPLLLFTNCYFYHVYTLETHLFLFLIWLNFYLYRKQDYASLGLAAAFLVLTRGEGALLLLVLAIDYSIPSFRRKPESNLPAGLDSGFRRNDGGRMCVKPQYFILPAILISAVYSFNFYYYGHIFSSTLAAKLGQGDSGLWGSGNVFLAKIPSLVSRFWRGQWWLFLATFIFAFFGARKIKQPLFLCFLSLYSLFYITLNIPGYHWYFAPLISFLLFYAGIGLARFPYIILLFAIPEAYISYDWITVKKPASMAGYISIGNWMREKLPPETSVATVEIGAIGYYSEHKIIDIMGLVTPLNAKFISEKKYSEWLNHYSPDYILVHEPFWPHEEGAAIAEAQKKYHANYNFNFAGYRLLEKN